MMKQQITFLMCSLILFFGFNTFILADIQIGTGTTIDRSIPIEPNYGYTYSQIIYLATEIGTTGDITSLQFYFSGTSLSNSNDWTIYIGHTTKSSFTSYTDWVPVSSMTQVYSAMFTSPTSSGWITFDITDFSYNGVDNLVIAVDENAPGYNSSNNDFYSTEVSGVRSMLYRNDATNPDPASPPSATRFQLYIANVILGGITQTCPPPGSLTTTNITQNSADLGWTVNGSESNWNIEWGLEGFTKGTGTLISLTTSNPYELTGLDFNTSYDWYVQADCDGTREESIWIGPENFSTLCGINNLPYFEDFDDQTPPAMPACMTVENTNGDYKTWKTDTDASFSYPNSASIGYNDEMDMDDWFFTEAMQLTGGETYIVQFAFKIADSYYPENLAVDWGDSPVSTAMSGSPIFQAIEWNDESWVIRSGEFTPATSGVYYVGFHGFSEADMYNLFVDDISVMLKGSGSTTWTGTEDDNWNNPNNWTAGVPNSTTDVTIPSGLSTYPTLTNGAACDNILLQSSSAGDAAILGDNYLSMFGYATIQRYVEGGKWHNISAPLPGQTVNNLYFDHNPEVWLRTYNEPDNTRTFVTDLSTPMNPGSGFEIWVEAGPRYDIIAEFTGELQNTENVVLNSSSDPALSYSGPEPLGYNLIGNPYASPLDWDIGSWGRTQVGGSVWVWDPGSGNYKTRAGGAGSLVDGIIPMGQGFFVQVTGSSPQITIPHNARVHSAQPFLKKSESTRNDLAIFSLKVNYGQLNDEVHIVFAEDATLYYDDGRDSRKLFSIIDTAPSLYAFEENEELSINGIPLLDSEGKTMEIRFKAGENGIYSLQADFEFLPDVVVILEDLKEIKTQNLNDNQVYTFLAEKDDQPGRFLLHFNKNSTGIKPPEKEPLVKVYAYNGNIYIRSTGNAESEEKEICVYDMLGRTVLHTSLSPSSFSKIPELLQGGCYVVKVNYMSRIEIFKVFNY